MGRDHDPDVGAALRDRPVSWRAVIGAIGGHLFDVSIPLIMQRLHLESIRISGVSGDGEAGRQ